MPVASESTPNPQQELAPDSDDESKPRPIRIYTAKEAEKWVKWTNIIHNLSQTLVISTAVSVGQKPADACAALRDAFERLRQEAEPEIVHLRAAKDWSEVCERQEGLYHAAGRCHQAIYAIVSHLEHMQGSVFDVKFQLIKHHIDIPYISV